MDRLWASIIIVTHNQSSILRLQLEALSRQAAVSPEHYEVIVTDDGSRLSELVAMRRLMAASQLRTRLFSQQTDRFWVSRARNRAIRAAEGGVLILLDGDMVPEQGFVQAHLDRHAVTPNLVLAGERIRRPARQSSEVEDFWRYCREYQPDLNLKMTQWQADEEWHRRRFLDSAQSWRAVFSCNMSVPARPEVYFDERFVGWGPEDWELAYRLSHASGFQVQFAPEAAAYEVDGLGDGVSNVFRVRSQAAIIDYLRNTCLFFDQCPGLSLEEAFWGFRKLAWIDDAWAIVPPDASVDLGSRVAEVRAWLKRYGIYEA